MEWLKGPLTEMIPSLQILMGKMRYSPPFHICLLIRPTLKHQINQPIPFAAWLGLADTYVPIEAPMFHWIEYRLIQMITRHRLLLGCMKQGKLLQSELRWHMSRTWHDHHTRPATFKAGDRVMCRTAAKFGKAHKPACPFTFNGPY